MPERGPSGTGHDTPHENVTEGMPPELARALRDPTIRLPQDDYKLADGRSLWEHLEEWRNAPSDTASADPPVAVPGPASEPICPGCKRPVSECQAEDVYEVEDAPGPASVSPAERTYRDPHSHRTPQQSADAAEKWCRDLPSRYIGIPLTQEPVTLLLEMADTIRELVLRGR